MRCEIYVEGGGEDSALDAACRRGFSQLFLRRGFAGKMPKVTPCGGRQETYREFRKGLKEAKVSFIALLVDSEDRIRDSEKPWDHLAARKDDPMPRRCAPFCQAFLGSFESLRKNSS